MYQCIVVSISQYQKILGRHTALQLEGELHLKGEGKGPSTQGIHGIHYTLPEILLYDVSYQKRVILNRCWTIYQ
jgi:hypothetical protein